MATREELLLSVRQKYPEYSDISDAELATSIATKYPDYAEELGEPVSTTAIQTQPSEFEQFRQAYISQQQAPTLEKAIEASIVNPLSGIYGMASDIAGIPAGLGEASGTETPIATTVRSLLEGGRRAGADILSLSETLRPKTFGELLMGPVGPLVRGVANLRSRTPSEAEIEEAFQAQQLQQELMSPESRLLEGDIAESLAEGTRSGAPMLTGLATAPGRAVARSVVMRPVTATANLAERVVSRGFRKPLEDVVTNVTGIPAIEGGIETAQVAKARIVEKTGKFPTREAGAAESVVKKADATGKALIDESKAFLKEAGDEGLVVQEAQGVEQAKQLLRERFDLRTADEGALDAIFDKPEFRNLGRNISPLQAQKHLQELNTKYHEFEPRFKTSIDALAYKTVRDYLSDQVDGIIKVQSGKNISPYRDWGNVQDFKQGLTDRIGTAQRTQAGIDPTQTGGIPTTQAGVIARGVRAVGGRPLVSRQIEPINQDTVRMGRSLRNPAPAGELTSEARAALRDRFVRPPAIPSQAPVVPPPNLEQLIQRTISDYPRDIRSRPELARRVAVQDLTDQGLISSE